jgi:hypothetical protein
VTACVMRSTRRSADALPLGLIAEALRVLSAHRELTCHGRLDA